MTKDEIKEIETNINMLLDMFDRPDSDENRFKIVERISEELSKLRENTVFLNTNQIANLNIMHH